MVCSFTIKRRRVTSHFYRSKISGCQYSFLTEMAICIVERRKKSMGYRFLLECNRAQESHNVNSFVLFSVMVCSESRPWLHDVQSLYGKPLPVTYSANYSNNSGKNLQCPSHLSRSEVFGIFSPTCSRKEHYIVNGLDKLQLYNTANQERRK